MDWNHLEQLRVNGFSITRRGYDTREVDKFLEILADWLETDAPQQLGDQAVQRKLELVGQSTAHILLAAEKEAQELRRTTQAECLQLREQAEATAREAGRLAEEYASSVRQEADEEAQATRDDAAEQARRTVEEADRRRAAMEELVAELEAQREAAVADLERLRGELLATISRHTTRTSSEPRQAEGRRKRSNIEQRAEAAN